MRLCQTITGAFGIAVAAVAVAPELSSGTTVAARAEPVREIEFIEVRNDAAGRARSTLKAYAAALRSGTAGAEVTVLEEIDRPDRFALVASAEGAGALEVAANGAEPLLQTLQDLLVAPIDRREHEELTPSCKPAPDTGPAPNAAPEPNAAPAPNAAAAARGFYVIAHLDIAARDREAVDAALREFARAVCTAAGHLALHIWRQSNRGNHFDLIAAWMSRGDWAAFSSSASARQFRATVGPLLGSPYDERLYRVVE